MNRSDFSSLLFASQLAPKEKVLTTNWPVDAPAPREKTDETTLLDSRQIRTKVSNEVRSQMSRLMHGSAARPPTTTSSSSASSHPSLFAPTFKALAKRIYEDLESSPLKLLALNHSRREAIAHYLDSLAGITPGPSTMAGVADAAGGLRRWIEAPRSPVQQAALRAYYEELALIALGQAILLKAWSDRGLRNWKPEDLSHLNWVLSTTLKPHVPLDREGWQITRPNIYSWYTPPFDIQKQIWSEFSNWRIVDEGPGLLISLICSSRGDFTEEQCCGYDERFFTSLWNHVRVFGFDPSAETGPFKRKRMIFSPTLRNGSMVRTGPTSVTWIGLEANPFRLMLAELGQLWWGPAAPPVWAVGNGLEVHSRDQLSFNLNSPKPSLFSRIAEMEACDLGIVLEERILRVQNKGVDGLKLREQLEALPYFKKLRSPGTSLGDMQACVAITKLRPGACLWWAREEPLNREDGLEVLGFLLDRAKLICEWDLSSVEHALPGKLSLFPKYIYLFQREPNLQERLGHRPHRISVQGQVRSHVEIPVLLEDSFISLAQRSSKTHGNWQIHLQQSPTTQKDWSERWPDPMGQNVIAELESLRSSSVPLGSIVTVRPTPEGDPARNHAWGVHATMKGFWIRPEFGNDTRQIVAESLPGLQSPAKGAGFLILVSDENSIPALKNYLESDLVQNWLDHHCERRGNRWLLKEQDIKWIPVPKVLVQVISTESGQAQEGGFALPLPGMWEKLASEVAFKPKLVLESLTELPRNEEGGRVRASIFMRTARALENLKCSQGQLFTMVNPDGRVSWRTIMTILPPGEAVQATLHPDIRLSGSMPLHLPITRCTRVRTPLTGISLATENGFHLQVLSENAMIIEILWDQMQDIAHPTWSELMEYLKLPRRLELAHTTASDILRMHGEQTLRIREFEQLLAECMKGF